MFGKKFKIGKTGFFHLITILDQYFSLLRYIFTIRLNFNFLYQHIPAFFNTHTSSYLMTNTIPYYAHKPILHAIFFPSLFSLLTKVAIFALHFPTNGQCLPMDHRIPIFRSPRWSMGLSVMVLKVWRSSKAWISS